MTNFEDLMARARVELAGLLSSGAPTREAALLLAEIEDEYARRRDFDARAVSRLDRLDGVVSGNDDGWVMDRSLPSGLDARAGVPRSWRRPTADELKRGVAIAYANLNPTFYRAVIDRLGPEEKFRIETQHGAFEMTRAQFEAAVPAMVRTDSYQRGTAGAPGAARYVTGRVPQSLKQYQDRAWSPR